MINILIENVTDTLISHLIEVTLDKEKQDFWGANHSDPVSQTYF